MSRNPNAGSHTGSGNKHRCEVCQHLPGPRATGRVAKDAKDGRTKKASCNHECHSPKQKEAA